MCSKRYVTTHTVLGSRDNAVVRYIRRNLWRHYGTMEGLHKPDIVATMGQVGVMLDIQVDSQQLDLERARR